MRGIRQKVYVLANSSPVPLVVLIAALTVCDSFVAADLCIVEQGEANAQIVVSDAPARMAALAAEELRTYIHKISGAHLPIADQADEGHAVHIYIGRSSHTDRRGVTDEGLGYGAYRVVSRDKQIILLGRDRDYTPKQPYLPSLGPREYYRLTPQFLDAWDLLTGHRLGFPYLTNFRNFNKELGIWNQDEAGSLNAVYALLRDLGVRWYLPGDLGEVVPSMKTIRVPSSERTVHPDFALRGPYQSGRRYAQTTRDEVLWQLRMGFNLPADLLGEDRAGALVHGLEYVATGRRRDENVKAHPKWFALYSGRRDPKVPARHMPPMGPSTCGS